MQTAAEAAYLLKRDGFNVHNLQEIIVGLEEDLHFSYGDAVAIAPMVLNEARRRGY